MKLIIFICVFLNYAILVAQTVERAVSFGGYENESTVLTKVDINGNLYSTGTFSSTISFGSINIPHVGLQDVFVQKRDENGNLLWAKSFGSFNNESASAIAIMDDGILISGTFEGTLDVDPSNNVSNLVSNGDLDIYLIKIDLDGNYVWSKHFGDKKNNFINDLDVDNNGDILLNIFFNDSINLSASITLEVPNVSLPISNGLIKLNPNADVLWAFSTGMAFAKDIAFDDNNNIYLTGFFLGEIDFDYSEETFLMIETGYEKFDFPINYDAFIQKLTPEGNFIWVKQLSNPYNIIGHSITLINYYTLEIY